MSGAKLGASRVGDQLAVVDQVSNYTTYVGCDHCDSLSTAMNKPLEVEQLTSAGSSSRLSCHRT